MMARETDEQRLDERGGLRALEQRLRALLPEVYRERVEQVRAASMGSAGLRYGADGRVAWGSFCDLAMAGGPPHRGSLLEPGMGGVDTDPYREVVREICRGIGMVTGLYAEAASMPGWVSVHCTSAGMAGWLARAMVMENVSARFGGLRLYVPVGAAYRLEKEIKNVVTSVAKTCHYWLEHTCAEEHDAIAGLLYAMERESPVVQPGLDGGTQPLCEAMAVTLTERTGMRCFTRPGGGWLGLECGEVQAAIWMMRALVASNAFARREETVVFVAVNAVSDPSGEAVVQAVESVHRFGVGLGMC
jgi:hypothetical protein